MTEVRGCIGCNVLNNRSRINKLTVTKTSDKRTVNSIHIIELYHIRRIVSSKIFHLLANKVYLECSKLPLLYD